jgi:hypothetical protein
MKTLLITSIFVAFSYAFSNCKASINTPSYQSNTEKVQISTLETDSAQYELIIPDVKFESFLLTQPPAEYYSKEYYETWNFRYVTEWNNRYHNPTIYGTFYETAINYSPHIDYGLDLNYKLYYYFLFIEKEYGVTLISRGKTQ